MKLKVNAKLDPQFQPLSLVCREMRQATKEGGQDLVIAIERNKGYTSTYKTRVYKDGTGHDEENFRFVERMTQTLGREVATGSFGADMQIELQNDGPVTIIIDTHDLS